MKAVKVILKILLVLVLVVALAVGGYVGYVALQYSRIPDYTPYEETTPQEQRLQTGQQYTAVTYNIGFGAYTPDFSFFMDTGTMADGTQTKGESARAASAASVQAATSGVLNALQQINADFVLLQEVDQKAHRSQLINQTALLQQGLAGYGSIYASNFHTPYFVYPVTNPIGASESGIMTFSRYKVGLSFRRSLPVTDAFPTKFFDLDRCFTVQYLPVEGTSSELVLINVHMSAYDEGGVIRSQQLDMLVDFLADEYAKGNYVIVGGDFNHALGDTIGAFSTTQQQPGWVVPLDESRLPEGFSVVHASNNTQVATCRASDIAYTPGINYEAVIDGFIVSGNVQASAWNIDLGYAYSDHNPVQLTFTLQGGEGEQAEEAPEEETPAE